MSRPVNQLLSELVLRQVHIRQHLGINRLDLWADGQLVRSTDDPEVLQKAVRKLFNLTDEEAAAVERELARIAGLS
jgi:hypothetical protein